MTLPSALFNNVNQTFNDNFRGNNETFKSTMYAVSSTAISASNVSSSSTFTEEDTNGSVLICGTNSSEEWQLVYPVCSTKYHSMWIFVIVAFVLSLITLWTILGNLLVLVALCRYAPLRTMSNCLIGNLAISDFLLALTVLPISTGNDLLGYWVFGELTCTLWLCIDVLYCTASIWGLCTVAFDRYLATVYPVWYHDQRSVRKAMGCIVFVWIFSIIISFAPFIGWQDMIPSFFTFNPQIRRHECILFTSSSYVLYSAMGSFIIPSILMTFMYIRIFFVLHRQSKGLKKKVSLPTYSPVFTGNGCPIICEPSEEVVNGVGRDLTTTTLISVANEDSSEVQELEKGSVPKVECDTLLRLPTSDSRPDTAISAIPVTDASNGSTPCVGTKRPSLPIPSKRSNSLTAPSDVSNGKLTIPNQLNVVDLERRNSHNVTMQRSNSDMCHINANMHEPKLSTQRNRSKSANVLTVGDEDEPFRTPPIPRRSLPCNIAKFNRNNRMTMSMKRRFELREQRATKRMLLIMACFCVCWMPFLFMYILRSVCDTCDMNHHFVAAIIWLGYVNSSLNPILYTLFNDDFREAFRRLIGLQSPKSARGRRFLR